MQVNFSSTPRYETEIHRDHAPVDKGDPGSCKGSPPPGKGHQIANRCSKINLLIRKSKDMNTEDNFTSQQIADRYNAKKAVFEAMTQGRKVSFLDSREFEVSEMHTIICKIRKDIDSKSLPWELKDQWISFGRHGKRCKEYWLERRVRS